MCFKVAIKQFLKILNGIYLFKISILMYSSQQNGRIKILDHKQLPAAIAGFSLESVYIF